MYFGSGWGKTSPVSAGPCLALLRKQDTGEDGARGSPATIHQPPKWLP